MMLLAACTAVMTEDERDYFKALGARVAQLRREQGLTQVQLAQALDISQQMVASYEVGRRRIPVSMLQSLARTLSMDVETLLGNDSAKARAKRGPAPRLQHHLERISALPKPRQRAVIDVIEAMLAQQAR